MQHKLKREGSTVFTRSAHETMVGFYSEMENCIAYGSGLDCFVRQSERDLNFMEQISMQPYKMWPTSFLKAKKTLKKNRTLKYVWWSTCNLSHTSTMTVSVPDTV